MYLENNNRLSLPVLIEQILSMAYLAHCHVILHYQPDNYRMFPENIFSAPLYFICLGSHRIEHRRFLLPLVAALRHWMQDNITDNKFKVLI